MLGAGIFLGSYLVFLRDALDGALTIYEAWDPPFAL
jgi:hypothetical protein